MSTQPAHTAPALSPSGRGGPLSRPCANCGAQPGEKCFWYCTARPTKDTDSSDRGTDAARRPAAPALVLTACALGAALTGCSSTAPHTTPPTRPAHPAASPAPSETGARLEQLLPTAGMFIDAVTVTHTSDTGTSWADPAHLPTPALPTAGCGKSAAISAGMFTTDYQAAAATETIAVGATFVQVVLEATNPGDAARQITEDTAYTQRCAGTGPVLDTYADLGDQAIRIRLYRPTDPHVPEVELVRVGNIIAAVSDTDLARDESITASIADYLAHQLEVRTA